MYPPPVGGVNPSPSDGGECLKCQTLAGTATGNDPVDLASGLMTFRAVDLSIDGARGSLAVPRAYRTLSANSGAFGLGSETPLNYELDTYDPQHAQAINLIAPDGNQFLFTIQPSGTFVNTTVPWLQGAVLTATAWDHSRERAPAVVQPDCRPRASAMGEVRRSLPPAL